MFPGVWIKKMLLFLIVEPYLLTCQDLCIVQGTTAGNGLPAALCKPLSLAQGLLPMLNATTAKSILKVNPFNKRGAHHSDVKIDTACASLSEKAKTSCSWNAAGCFS